MWADSERCLVQVSYHGNDRQGFPYASCPECSTKSLAAPGNGRASDHLSLGLDQLQRKAKVRLPGFGGWFMEKLLLSFLAAPPTVCSGDSQLPSRSLLYSGEAEATLRGCSYVLLLLLSHNRYRSCE